MAVATLVIASILALAGWVLSLAGISGMWLVLAAGLGLDLLYDGSWDFVATTIVFAVLCALAEIAELVAGLLGARAFGGSRSSQVGAFLGTLAGGLVGSALIPVPIVGTIVGVVAGGFAGALLGELRHQKAAMGRGEGDGTNVKTGVKAGVGAMIAKIVAIAIKVSLASVMIVWFVVVAWSNAAD
jgi:hypothetical protein